MSLKRVLGAAVLLPVVALFLLACGVGSVPFISKAEPTATRRPTREPRATFTPRPAPTDTVEPTATDQPTATDEPTQAPTDVPPTKKPVVRATARPLPKPTDSAPQPTSPPPPTTNPFKYTFVPATCNTDDPAICNAQGGVHCEHSGQHTLKVLVFGNIKDPGSELSGVKVRFSGGPGGAPIEPDEVTGPDGVATKTLSSVTDPPTRNTGTFYAWLVDSNKNPISPFSPPIVINALKEDQPNTCWEGQVSFAGNG